MGLKCEKARERVQRTWKASIEHDLRGLVFSLAHSLTGRLSQEEMISAITQKQAGTYWQDTAFAAGYPSLALLCYYIALCTQEEQARENAYTYLQKAVKATQDQPLQEAGLAKGTSGLANVLSFFEQEDEQFRQASANLTQQLARQAQHTTWVKTVCGHEVLDYDAVRGASGVLRTLLIQQDPNADVTSAIIQLLQILVAFASDPDAWLIHSSFFPVSASRYPDQFVVNCGLAHGLPGPLVALSLASLAGYSIDRQNTSIQHLASWLADRFIQAPWGIDWPDVIPAHAALEQVRQLPPARSGWCYGAPGVVRSLWLAGQALGNDRFRELAVQGIRATLQRPHTTRRIDPLTLCHGEAGLLMVALRFLKDTEDPFIEELIPGFVHRILARFQPDAPFGFRYDFHVGSLIDSLGFFTGAVGTLLALLAASSSVEPKWDRALLLS